jgi:hypothetical protein
MTPPHRTCRGFALLAVLMLVGLIGLLGATYTRHTTIVSKSSSVALSALRARSAVDSGVQYARQCLRTGRGAASASLATGSADAVLQIADLGGDRSRVEVRSLDSSGIGATLLLEASRVPRVLAGEPDDLPRLRATTVLDLMADASVPKTWIGSSTTLTDTDVAGLLIVQDGATLTLDGVVVHGAIVSAGTMTSALYGAYDAASAPRLVVAGDVRLTPAAWLPGISLVMPDGDVQGALADSRVQWDGAVVAHALALSGSGALHDHVASVVPPALAAGVERPFAARGPRPWAAGLDLGEAFDTASLAILPRAHAAADLPAITGYGFDAP